MSVFDFIGICFSLAIAGAGIGLGFRLLQLRRATARSANESTETSPVQSKRDARRERRRLTNPRNTRRTTEIHGINRLGYIRHTDGSYTRGYRIEMPATLYSDDAEVDRIYNDFARMFQSVRQAGCVIQLRHDVWVDSGRALREHLKAQAHTKDTFTPARMLHTVGLTGTESLARDGSFQDDRLTLWARVPIRHSDDPSLKRLSKLARFPSLLIKELRRQGFKRFMGAVLMSWTQTNREYVFARVCSAERAACEAASQIFAGLEQMSPVRLHPFTREEMWRETFLAHRQNEKAVPALSLAEAADLRQPLCGEELSSKGGVLMHGDCPVTLVSLFRPPTPVISAGMMRVTTANPSLTFRHTTIIEYLIRPSARQDAPQRPAQGFEPRANGGFKKISSAFRRRPGSKRRAGGH